MATTDLTAQRLRELLDYDPETGLFRRLVRTSPRVKVGVPFGGSPDRLGYLQIRVDVKRYPAHRLVWLHFYGVWPKHEIDHIDRNKANNALANLRDVTHFANMQNLAKRISRH